MIATDILHKEAAFPYWRLLRFISIRYGRQPVPPLRCTSVGLVSSRKPPKDEIHGNIQLPDGVTWLRFGGVTGRVSRYARIRKDRRVLTVEFVEACQCKSK